MTTPQPADATDVWWSPSENVLYVHPCDAPERWVSQPAAPRRAASWAVPALPADAVRLVPSERDEPPVSDRVETAARVLHSRRHRAGYSHCCDACRGDARAVAAALTATEENTR